MQRDRAWRRVQTIRVQSKRYRDLKQSGFTIDWLKSPNKFGKLKNNHHSCSCFLCKPWKHGMDYKLPFSQRKKLR